MNCEEIDKMGPGLQGGARRIPALLGVIFIYEVGAAAAMARSDADRELQCVPVDLDSVPTDSLSLDAWTRCRSSHGRRPSNKHPGHGRPAGSAATRGRRWTVPGGAAPVLRRFSLGG